MNIAPYLFAADMGWIRSNGDGPEDFDDALTARLRVARQFHNLWRHLTTLFPDIASAPALGQLSPNFRRPFCAVSLKPSQFDDLIDKADTVKRFVGEFIGIRMFEDAGKVLMFPDDSSDFPAFSFFVPDVDREERIALRSITFAIDLKDRVLRDIFGSWDKRCTPTREVTADSHTLKCLSTGCPGECVHQKVINGKHAFAIRCLCEC